MSWEFIAYGFYAILAYELIQYISRKTGFTKKFSMSFYTKDELQLFQYLRAQPDQAEYIKMLIREDMERTQAEQD